MGRRATLNAKKRNRRIITISIVVVIIAAVVVLALIINSTSDPNAKYIGLPVDPSVLQQITGVSDGTLNTVAVPSGVTAPNAITGTALTSGGKPEVVYVGGDYCPFCAVERWSLIMALSRFGNFTGLQYMESSATDENPNTPTFTFSNASYSSPYLAFLGIEEANRADVPVITLTAAEQALVSSYDVCPSGGSGGVPFVDIANQYAVDCGAQSALDISGQNWTQVAPLLDTASNPTAQLIDGATNTLITAFCKIDGGLPATVCTQSYATVTLAYTTASGGAGQQSMALLTLVREEARWTSSASRL
jgi:hypothetical protein